MVFLAALLAWKGVVFQEGEQVRRFLGMQEPTAADFWWTGAGCAIVLVLVGYAITVIRERRGPHQRTR
ncbi:MAG: hypothetical protein PVG72_11625 [Gammaproteobacteria bacterium]|jgi:hypothetical protein